MKKSLTLVLTMCVASAMVLSACGESKPKETTTAETTTAETTVAAEESSEETTQAESEEESSEKADETEEQSEEAEETTEAAETKESEEAAVEKEEASETEKVLENAAEETSEEAAAETEEAAESAEEALAAAPVFKMSEKAAEEAPADEKADAAAPAGESADDSSSEAIGKQTEELEITVDGVTGLAQYEDVEDGTSEVRHFKVTFEGKEYYGTIDKGVWAADDAEGDAVIAAYQQAHESDPSFMGAPGAGGSGDGESPAGESTEAPSGEASDGAAPAAEGETPPAKPEGNPPEGAPAEPDGAAPAQAEAEAAEVTVTFSTGETAKAVVGEPFEFFFQCDAPGDMGAPAEGEEGAGITVSSGTVEYSNVGLGGPNSYPTSEKVIITGFEGDFEVTVCDEASAMDATHTIYFDEAEIEEAIANAEAMAAQMAANPMDGSSEDGESPAGESTEAPAQAEAEAAEVTVTFSTGETAKAVVGEPFEFFFQCDAPGDMGAPAEGEEGAGITVSSGTVEYSNVGLGGPNSYPTSEKVIITGFEGDFEVTVCDEASAMDATHTIYFDEAEIEEAIANAEAMAAQMAANPMDGSSEDGESPAGESTEAPAGEASDGEAPAAQGEEPPAKPEGNPPEGAPAEPGAEAPAEEKNVVVPVFKMSEKAAEEAPAAEAPADDSSSEAIGKQTEELEITVDGVTGLAQYEDVEDGTSEVRHFKVTFDGKEYYGTIDKGVWAADDAEGDAVIAAYQQAHESDPSFMGAPGAGGSGDGESPAGESAEAPAGESADGEAPAAQGEEPPAKPEGNPPEGAPAEPEGAAPAEEAPAAEDKVVEFNSIIKDILNGTSSLIDRSKYQKTSTDAAEAETPAAADGESMGDMSDAPAIPEGLQPGEEPPGGFGGID